MKDYILRKNTDVFRDLRVMGLTSGSDMLFDETRKIVSRALGGVPIVSRYSNEKNGVLGQDEDENNVFPLTRRIILLKYWMMMEMK